MASTAAASLRHPSTRGLDRLVVLPTDNDAEDQPEPQAVHHTLAPMGGFTLCLCVVMGWGSVLLAYVLTPAWTPWPSLARCRTLTVAEES